MVKATMFKSASPTKTKPGVSTIPFLRSEDASTMSRSRMSSGKFIGQLEGMSIGLFTGMAPVGEARSVAQVKCR